MQQEITESGPCYKGDETLVPCPRRCTLQIWPAEDSTVNSRLQQKQMSKDNKDFQFSSLGFCDTPITCLLMGEEGTDRCMHLVWESLEAFQW